MYWPIGAPNVYALSKDTLPAANVTRSDDGLSNASSTDGEPATQDGGNTNFRDGDICDVKVSRAGGIFATVTQSSLVVWQSKPTVALAGVVRSPQSVKSYGPNAALLMRPDGLMVVVQTTLGFLITYSITTDANARIYQAVFPDSSRHVRRGSGEGYASYRKPGPTTFGAGAGEGDGIREVNVRFRMVIRIDAGISKSLALDDELVIATQKPSALQCIRWVTENGASQTSTELVNRMQWVGRKAVVTEIVYDRPMNLAAWITNDGRAFAVQRRNGNAIDPEDPKSLFQGFCFREPETDDAAATKTAINARFSLIAVGCANGQIDVYIVKDYTGNIPLSHKIRLPVGLTTTGKLTCLSYSPDGYCLFAGYEHGWATWTVYGKASASSFSADRAQSRINDETWLEGINTSFWMAGGCELALLPIADNRIWILDMARNSMTSCLSPANVSRGLLHTSNSIMIYKGHEASDITSLPSEMPLWQTVQAPSSYLAHHWPIKTATVSSDGKYVAISGRRGLAHYSVASGRWRSFDDPQAEAEFAVRGGMCWYQHILIVAVEVGTRYEIRLYSREKQLDYSHVQHVEQISAPAISTTVAGTDSLLVYTYDNTLLHFIIIMGSSSVRLVQVGQIGFHGIIRAPPRVRAISWILPDDQLEHGDPSQDVATASVLFLVDGRLVLLQPSTNDAGELKYDMRVIAQNVEYFMLLRDQPNSVALLKGASALTEPASSTNGLSLDGALGHSLRDSLWYFDGTRFNVWSDIQDVMACAPTELERELPQPVAVPLDFPPLSVMISKGIIFGVEADLVQRRDVNFSFFRHATRSQLFLPQLLHFHLAEFNSPAALHLSQSYEQLAYFPHALEVLLHDTLDVEVDNPPSPPETALLPTILSFLSSFDSYLDVVVNCTRKTELRSWQTLFSYLPPVNDLFEQSLARGKLNTAAGYLLVLHAFEQESFQVSEFAQLLRRAAIEQDWELCKELARFLVGIDVTGETLQAALAEAGLHNANGGPIGSLQGTMEGHHHNTPHKAQHAIEQPGSEHTPGLQGSTSGVDYFSTVQALTPP